MSKKNKSHTIIMEVGDTSGDGHNKREKLTFTCNFSKKAIIFDERF